MSKIKNTTERWNGKTYSEIEDETAASTATISRINKCLLYGAEGYKKVLEKLERK